MRILIYGLNYSPELTGIGKYTGEMVAYLAGRGHEIHVVTAPPYYPYWKVQPGYSKFRYTREKQEGVTVFRCPLWVPKNPGGFMRLAHLFSFALSSAPVVLQQKIIWKPEIVISIAPTLFCAVPALFLNRLIGVKSWLHIQDFEMDAAFDLGMLHGKSWGYKFASAIERRLFNGFDLVSTISRRMLERLWEKEITKDKTVLFPNWIDTNMVKPQAQTSVFRKEWNIPDDKVVVLYSGNMGRKQGLEILVEVASFLVHTPEIVFVLCGDGAARSQLQERAQVLPNVFFYPLQPIEKLNELLNLADIHILPQRADAADLVMPSKLSGILASGKVVIATAPVPSELGVIVSEVGILTTPGNARELSDAVLKLANNSALRISLGKRGRNWVVTHWEKSTILQDLELILHSLLES